MSCTTHDVINQLSLPIPNERTLIGLLCGPLSVLNALPSRLGKFKADVDLKDDRQTVGKLLPRLQRVILSDIVPTWQSTSSDVDSLLLQYFHPDPSNGSIARHGLSTILTVPLSSYSIGLLDALAHRYPADVIYTSIFGDGAIPDEIQLRQWEDYVKDVCSVPAKVANYSFHNSAEKIPEGLESKAYFSAVALQTERLISHSQSDDPLILLLTKLQRQGLFPASPPTTNTQSSFFDVTLPTIRKKSSDSSYSNRWQTLLRMMPSTITQRTILTSLIGHLTDDLSVTLESSVSARSQVADRARVLRRLIGSLPSEQTAKDTVISVLLNAERNWNQGHARVFVAWVAGSTDTDQDGLQALMQSTLELWGSLDHVKHSFLAFHQYVTALLLITISYLPASSHQTASLAVNTIVINGVGRYISHMDRSVRTCGMLAGEYIAKVCGKHLDFKDWEGDENGRKWARDLRSLLSARDIEYADTEPVAYITPPASPKAVPPTPHRSIELNEGEDSDDSVQGYDSPSSSRAPSPTPSELDEIEKDPSLAIQPKKPQRPVYLAQLGDLIRGVGGLVNEKSSGAEQADKIEIALEHGEALIRRKRDYGTELSENAADLVINFMGLNDSFDLEGFQEKRQAILIALVACCPQISAPSIAQEFFKNQYSVEQRWAMLNALVFGARDIANVQEAPVAFPSKMLSNGMHQKYAQDGQIQNLLDGISRDVVGRSADEVAQKAPQIMRERQLRIRRPPNITPISSSSSPTNDRAPKSSKNFTDIAAEYFVAPLINRFWLFFRDEQTREDRTMHQSTLYRYRSSGTGLILNPLVLSRYLASLAVLVHESRNAIQWLSVIAPDALELAVTLGTRRVTSLDEPSSEQSPDGDQDPKETEAGVLTAALELALVVLDGCLEVDGGRSISLEHSALLLGTEEWVTLIFSQLEKGIRLPGGGGAQHTRLQRIAAGLVMKVDQLISRWRQSMLQF